jgi:hypothetical protein
LGAQAVGDFKAEAGVFDVGDDAGVVFYEAAEFEFPVAVGDDEVDGAFAGIRGPAFGFAGVKIDPGAGSFPVVGVEERLDGPLPFFQKIGADVFLFLHIHLFASGRCIFSYCFLCFKINISIQFNFRAIS